MKNLEQITTQIEKLKGQQLTIIMSWYNEQIYNINQNWDMGLISFQEKLAQIKSVTCEAEKDIDINDLENVQ